MFWGIAAVFITCFNVALADELENWIANRDKNRDNPTLTEKEAKSWIAGRDGVLVYRSDRLKRPTLISEITQKYATQNIDPIVVHAEAVEPLALKTLSRKRHVVYRKLKTLSPEHLKHLDKHAYRPSLPSIESMTPELAKQLGICKVDNPNLSVVLPLHLCGLKSIDSGSLEYLKDVPLCLCGLESLPLDNAEVLASRDITAGVVLSRKTKVPENAWRVIEERVANTRQDPKLDAATLLIVTAGLRIIEDRCKHRENTFATDDELRANQPPPPKRPSSPNPFNRQ